MLQSRYLVWCLCFIVPSLIQAKVNPDHYVFDDVAKPQTENFQECFHRLVDSRWVCWYNAAITFQTKSDYFLKQWPSQKVECCAVWDAENCIDIKRNNYAACHSPESVQYFKQIQEKYMENGCLPFSPPIFDCYSLAARLSLSNSLILITTLAYIVFGLC